jgi:hypothetical protein
MTVLKKQTVGIVTAKAGNPEEGKSALGQMQTHAVQQRMRFRAFALYAPVRCITLQT